MFIIGLGGSEHFHSNSHSIYFYAPLLNYPLYSSTYGNIKCLPVSIADIVWSLCAVSRYICGFFGCGWSERSSRKFSERKYRFRIKKVFVLMNIPSDIIRQPPQLVYSRIIKIIFYALYSHSVYPFIICVPYIIVLLCFKLFCLLTPMRRACFIHFQCKRFLIKRKQCYNMLTLKLISQIHCKMCICWCWVFWANKNC